MDARLKKVVETVEVFAREGDPLAMTTRLQEVLNVEGLRHTFTEDELREALDRLGVDPDDQDSWFEEMASWL
jgi:hypothetical protein